MRRAHGSDGRGGRFPTGMRRDAMVPDQRICRGNFWWAKLCSSDLSGTSLRIGKRNSDAGAGADGRDHWPNCFTTVLAGGGVKGGTVYGASDRHAAFPAVNPVAPVDLISTVYHCLGVPDGQTLTDAANRPHVICPGSPLLEILA